MKKKILSFMLTFGLAFGGMCVAEQTQGTITLRPGLNVASTPAVLSSITFSNGGSNITAFIMSGGKWEQLIIDDSNASSVFRPLQGVLLRNNNSEDVTMTYNYNRSQGLDITLSRGLEAGWNFLGITREDNPFNDIAENTATMIIDFTNNTKSNAVVEGVTYETNASRFKLGKAYGVFLTKAGGTYGGINNYADVNNWSRNLTINYVYSKGGEAATSHTETVEEGNEYSVVSPEIDYYTADKTTVSGTMGMNDETITVTYSPINDTNSNNVADEEETYILSIYYEFSGGAIATGAYSGKILEGDSYSITSPTIEYYTPSVEIVSGTMPGEDKDITVVYNPTNDVNKNGVADETEAILEYVNSSIRNVIAAGVSDLDVLKINVPEGKGIYEIKLQKYGATNLEGIDYVWLENQYGEVVANAKSLNTDGIVNLLLKEEFNDIDKQELTVVVQTNEKVIAGGKLGFKVIEFVYNDENFTEYGFDDDYIPHLYDVVNYAGYVVRLSPKGVATTYNYVKGTSYEVASFNVQTPSAVSIMFKGFTLTNHADGSKLDLEQIDTVSVTVGGNEVSNIYYKVTLDDELFIAFDDYELPAGTTNEVVVNVIFKETFDDYGTDLKLMIYSASDIRVMEKLNEVRNVIVFDTTDWPTYSVHGGKITLTNTKLGNIDVATNSEGVVIGEGNINVTEPIDKITFSIEVNGTGVDHMYLIIKGEEFDGVKTNSDSHDIFTFNNVEIFESGKAQFKVDILDDSELTGNITFTAFNKNAFSGSRYYNSHESVMAEDVVGSISLSKVTIQAAKVALENNLTKKVEFLQNETSRKVVFDGIYTSKKGDVYLNEFSIQGDSDLDNNTDITFYLSIDGEEVADIHNFSTGAFSNAYIGAGESVSVKVEAEVEAYGLTGELPNMTLTLGGEDAESNVLKPSTANLVGMSIVDAGSVTISTTSSKQTILLKAKNSTIARFVIKPDNYDYAYLDKMSFDVTLDNLHIESGDIRLKIDDIEEDLSQFSNSTFNYDINREVPSDGLTIQVILKPEYVGTVELSNLSINNKSFTNTFTRRFEKALVYFVAQENRGDETKFTLGVETFDEDITVSNLVLKSNGNILTGGSISGEIVDGDYIYVLGDIVSKYVDEISYDYSDGITTNSVIIKKSEFNDYFKIGSDYVRVYKVD